MEMADSKFDDIRAYRDDEIPAAAQRIADDPQLESAARFAFPNLDIEVVKHAIRSCKTTDEIQRNIMYPVIRTLIQSTTDGFSNTGTERVPAGCGRMFISNHRDITCDAMLMQYALFEGNLPTTDIALYAISFGDIVFTTSPFEQFDSDAQAVRAASPFKMTFTCAYSNGHHGYLPSTMAYPHGSYEVYTTYFVQGTSDEVVKGQVDLINQLSSAS